MGINIEKDLPIEIIKEFTIEKIMGLKPAKYNPIELLTPSLSVIPTLELL